MKNYILAVLVIPLMVGCANLKDMIPSFWDANQSQMIINVRQSIDKLNCDEAHAPQVQVISDQLRWFELYSESKKTRDVQKLIQPMQETVADFLKRSNEKQGSKAYCEIKKKALALQAKAVASAVLGRY